jgi:hypothetical protein
VSARPYVPGDWRRYPRPEGAVYVGTGALGFVDALRGRRSGRHGNTNARAAKRQRQRELLRTTGFAGGYAEIGHTVTFELRQEGYHPSVARYGGHLAAVGGRFNFQGNRRVAEQMGKSVRSTQRYRAQLEKDGKIVSGTIEAGEMVEGMDTPARRAHVTRDVSRLRALALSKQAQGRNAGAPIPPKPAQPRTPTGPSAAEVPRTVVPMTAADWERVQASAPEWLRTALPSDAAPRTPRRPITEPEPPRVPAIDPKEIDQWDRDTEALEAWHERQRRRPDPPS